ncbi:putative nucleotidyltransferase, ribonuclease H [Tanacetum coccineum]
MLQLLISKCNDLSAGQNGTSEGYGFVYSSGDFLIGNGLDFHGFRYCLPTTPKDICELWWDKSFRLHGTPTSIVSDRDPKFTSCFWKDYRKLGTRLNFSTAISSSNRWSFKRTIQTLEICLRLVLWKGRKCRAPNCWDGSSVSVLIERSVDHQKITNEKVAVAKEKLKEARSRQKSYADKHRRDLEFQVGDRVFLKVSPFRGVKRFGIKDKLSPRFIGPF